jgi:hypothetical protein
MSQILGGIADVATMTGAASAQQALVLRLGCIKARSMIKD